MLSNSLTMLITNQDERGSHTLPSLLLLSQLKDSLRSLRIEAPALPTGAERIACPCGQGRSTTSQHATIIFFLWVGRPRELWASRRKLWVSVISAWYMGTKPERARCRQPQQDRANRQWTFTPNCPQHGSLLPKRQSLAWLHYFTGGQRMSRRQGSLGPVVLPPKRCITSANTWAQFYPLRTFQNRWGPKARFRSELHCLYGWGWLSQQRGQM